MQVLYRLIKSTLWRLFGINTVLAHIDDLQRQLNYQKEAMGRIATSLAEKISSDNIQDYEFKVYSQWGEDGIIERLVSQVAVERKFFIEFGVENYTESNTRYLLTKGNWSGLVIDSSEKYIKYIKEDAIYWQHNLNAVCAFITRENINQLISDNGVSGEIGLLSIDIDGNDYWIWQAIKVVNPVIVILEYNSRFGKEKSVSVPYKSDFIRRQEHPSGIYFGASLRALVSLSNQKGYAFVGCNSNGNNSFFVRRDALPKTLRELSVDEGFVAIRSREIWIKNGRTHIVKHQDEAAILADLPMVEVFADGEAQGLNKKN